ncbi:MAG: alpha/beta hydrolase [Acidobacteriota bacterium]
MPFTFDSSEQRKNVSIEGISTSWLDAGRGEAIVALHGIPTSSALFEPIVPFLNDYRLIAPDLLGQGLTDAPTAGLLDHAAYAHHLDLFMQKIPPRSFHLLLHDLGGVLGLGWAADNAERVRSLIILSTTITASFRVSVLYAANLIFGREMLRRALPRTMKREASLDPSLVEMWADPWTRRRILRGRDHFARRHLRRLRAKLGRLKCPALIIWGEEDDIFPLTHARMIMRELTQAKLAVIERCGHWSPVDAPEEVGKLMVEFFRGLRHSGDGGPTLTTASALL